MIQRSFRVVLGSTVLGLAAFGCGSDDSSRKNPPAPVAPPILEAPRVKSSAASLNLVSSSTEPRLVGAWKSKCLRNPDGSGAIIAVEITENYFQQTQSLFADANCQRAMLEARFIAAYTANKSQLQTTLNQTHAFIHDPVFAQAAQTGSSCGFNRWNEDVWYDLTDKECVRSANGIWVSPTKSGSKGSMTYSIAVKGSNTELDLGDGLVVSRPSRAEDSQSTPISTTSGTPLPGARFSGIANPGVVFGLRFEAQARQ